MADPALSPLNRDTPPILVRYNGHSSRLFESVREKLGLAYMVGGFEVLGLDRGYYIIYAAVVPESVDKAKVGPVVGDLSPK